MNGNGGNGEAKVNPESEKVVQEFFGSLIHNLQLCGATKNETKTILENVYRKLEDKSYDPYTKAEVLLKQHRLRVSVTPEVVEKKLVLV